MNGKGKFATFLYKTAPSVCLANQGAAGNDRLFGDLVQANGLQQVSPVSGECGILRIGATEEGDRTEGLVP